MALVFALLAYGFRQTVVVIVHQFNLLSSLLGRMLFSDVSENFSLNQLFQS